MVVVLQVGDAEQPLGSVDELDRALDAASAGAEPVLVSLSGNGAVLTIGVGRNDVAVALYLTPDGRPMSARSALPVALPGDDDLAFRKDGHTYTFFHHAAVRPDEARRLARSFVETPGVPPMGVTWVPEPDAPEASDEPAGR